MNIKKLLSSAFLVFLTTVSFASTVDSSSFSSTYKTSQYTNVKTTKLVKVNLSHLKYLDVEIETLSKSGSINFKLVDKNNKVVFEFKNPTKIDKKFTLNFDEDYQLLIDLKDFSGKYEVDLESKNK